ncbi:CHC2 zinc finger domain-containing protein [Neobacillus sp. FSL H8-0543]|uniref:CHC2 zinc finger domain-containing protein n=1 Tax=Neobacillus sp. FSL H8-0543 TaxID=2954672 RepID=UPI0031597DEA
MSTNICKEIKNHLSIAEALDRYTDANLSKAKIYKKQFNICCPWHADKNPSLTIYTESNTWHCWAGCGGGDVINLVAKSKNVSNDEAIKLLIKDLGINTTSFVQNSQEYKINRGLKEFNHTCKLYSCALHDLKISLLDEAKSLKDVYDLEQKGDVYHTLARIE